jgi:hypothetical protein
MRTQIRAWGRPELELCCAAYPGEAEVHCGLQAPDAEAAIRRVIEKFELPRSTRTGSQLGRSLPRNVVPRRDTGWVCAGMPCTCNRADAEHLPALPPGFRVDRDKDGSRH